MMKISKNELHGVLINIAFLIGLFLSHSRIEFQFVNLVLVLILYFTKDRLLPIKQSPSFEILFLYIIITSFSINLILGYNIALKDLGRLISFVLLFGLFPFVQAVRISNKVLYFSLLFIFLSQIAYVLNISILVNIFDRLYPYSGDVRGFTSEFLLESSNDINSIVQRRYGGLYHNPNQAARYVTLILVVFLLESKSSSIKKIIPFMFITIASLSLSGSRTGLIVGGLTIIIYFLIMRYNMFRIHSLLLISSFIFIIGLLLNQIFGSNELRIFQIAGGIEESIGTKVNWFLSFIVQINNPLLFYFGHFTSNDVSILYGIPLLDSEWGELFYSFGMLGTIMLIISYLRLFLLKDRNIRFYLIILLWCISSTVLFSFRMSFLFMLLLSKYYSEYRKRRSS